MWIYIFDAIAGGMIIWVVDMGLGAGWDVQEAEQQLKGAKEDGRCGSWEFAVHENGSDTGRSRLTFRPLACCSRGAFINSSVLIPRIDEWPSIAIPRAHCPYILLFTPCV